jgi:hypothetical protein
VWRGLHGWLSVSVIVLAFVLWMPGAAAAATGPHETVDETFTMTQPGAPTGLSFTGRYHAAGDENGNPPFMRRMVFYLPSRMRLDTSVPPRCSATDAQLSIEGPDACPAGSRLGGGMTNGIFFAPLAQSVVIDRYNHTIDVMNAADEQVMLVHAEGYSVVHGQVGADGSLAFESPTCFPTPPTGCADDYVLQLGSSVNLPAYTTASGQSYATTLPACAASGHWTTTIAFWWSDGSLDRVPTTQPCVATS